MIFDKIKNLLIENFEVEEDEITAESLFLRDLGFDELDFWDLVMDIEDVFSVELPEDISADEVTVGDIVKIIEENI